ncbi:MAG TPA: magnesium protoporphyrin IX methyltransferase [Steroidobacteraceae bacterium]
MMTLSYQRRRGELETYFDRTAVDAWARLTSTAPVSKIRATVRAGRDQMRSTLLQMLPADLQGQRLLDAGCGTGALSVGAAQRWAQVVAVDLSPTLVNLARERLPAQLGFGSIEFRVGDMFDTSLGEFDHVVAMDSLIHYQLHDVVRVLAGFAAHARRSILFTFAPKTPALAVLWAAGRLFPRRDRAPAITPIAEPCMRRALAQEPALRHWRVGRTQRVTSGFYKSQAMELVKL